MTRRLPRWTNERAVAERVAAEIDEAEALVNQLAWIEGASVPDHVRPVEALLLARVHREIADAFPSRADAIERAKRGDLGPLADLVRDGALTLTPEARFLVFEFLARERNLRTGRPRGRAGRPKMSETARRARNRVHDAADEFDVIRTILRRLYPEKDDRQVNTRAEEIAKDRAKIATSILKLRNRSRKSGHQV